MSEEFSPHRLMEHRDRRLWELMAKAGFRNVSHLAQTLSEGYPDLAINRAGLSRLLNGKRPRPNVHLIHAVARELGVTMDELYELLSPPPTPA